ncbi:caspase family protein [Novosphingobium sp.]|uniref:caspase family protein n=1 Tax=Novosphingobium sp. TaxID=1874826 RepID=UPI00333E9B23
MLSGPVQAAVPRRVALVIGISQYASVPQLTNPQVDADAVAKALRGDGFDVIELTRPADLGRTALWTAISTFKKGAVGAEAAVIYYAGHGVEVGGRNWLLPADAKAGSPDELEGSAIATNTLINAVSGASLVRLVILDACRDNPFAGESGWAETTRSVAGPTRGLAREVNLPPNVVVLLATQPGLKANDGKGGTNSPFAQALSAALTNPGLRISSLPTMVSRQMRALSGVDQRPDQQGIFDEPDWTFRAGPTNAAVALPAGPAPAFVAPAPVVTAPARMAPLPAPAATAAAPVAQTARGYGLVLQSRTDGQPGLLVVNVEAASPFAGTVKRGDVILKLNSATPAEPQSVIGVLDQDRRASISLQRDGQGMATSMALVLPKNTDDD